MSAIKKLVFASIFTLVALLGVNLLCALGERLAYGAFWGEDRPKGLYEHRTGERPRLKANARLNGWLYQISTNSLGFRGKELKSPKPPDSLRVWTQGGSTTFDIFASTDEDTWPAQTEAFLQESFPNQTVEVLNAGIPGEVISGSMTDFQRWQKEVQADYVVLYHGPNDLRQLLASPRGQQGTHQQKDRGVSDIDSPFAFLLDRKDIALIRVLRRNIQEIRPIEEEWKKNQMTQGDLNILQQRLEQAIRNIKQSRAIPVLATHALRAQDGDTGEIAKERVAESAALLRMTPEKVISVFHYYNKMVEALSIKYHCPLADLRSVVGAEQENWGDATHFAPNGSRLAGKEVARAIAEYHSNR